MSLLDPHESFAIISDLDEFLAAQKSHEATSTLPAAAQHPSVSFYMGTSTAVLVTAVGPAESLSVIDLHVRLLPPTSSFESESDRVADHASVALTKLNWAPLLQLLLPTFYAGCAPPASPLTFSAWQLLRREPVFMDRMHYSYSIVLHFYGWRLHDQEQGTLDRHKNWRERYAALETADQEGYYRSLTYVLRHLLEFKLAVFALHFGLFLMEEFRAGRLLVLRGCWELFWWPMIRDADGVDDAAKKNVQRRYSRLGQSDSD